MSKTITYEVHSVTTFVSVVVLVMSGFDLCWTQLVYFCVFDKICWTCKNHASKIIFYSEFLYFIGSYKVWTSEIFTTQICFLLPGCPCQSLLNLQEP
jgi:hypothetical protein